MHFQVDICTQTPAPATLLAAHEQLVHYTYFLHLCCFHKHLAWQFWRKFLFRNCHSLKHTCYCRFVHHCHTQERESEGKEYGNLKKTRSKVLRQKIRQNICQKNHQKNPSENPSKKNNKKVVKKSTSKLTSKKIVNKSLKFVKKKSSKKIRHKIRQKNSSKNSSKNIKTFVTE